MTLARNTPSRMQTAFIVLTQLASGPCQGRKRFTNLENFLTLARLLKCRLCIVNLFAETFGYLLQGLALCRGGLSDDLFPHPVDGPLPMGYLLSPLLCHACSTGRQPI